MIPKIRVAVTRDCGMSCVYCPRGSSISMENYDGQQTTCLSDDELLGILDVLVQGGLQGIHLTGGEPLRRPGLDLLIQGMSKLGVPIELNTNGLGLTSENTQRFKDCGVSLLKVSLDVPNRGAFLSLTGLDAFERVVDGIREAVPILPVRLNCVVMQMNKDSLVELVKLANEFKVSRIHLLDLTYYPCIGGKTMWEREFVYLTHEVMPVLENAFGSTFSRLPIYGCRFYEMESMPGGTIVVLKEAEPTMRASICDECQEFCHEGVFTLRLSAGGYLNICPCQNGTGVDALQLYKQGQLLGFAKKFGAIFDQAQPQESFATFLSRNGLVYEHRSGR